MPAEPANTGTATALQGGADLSAYGHGAPKSITEYLNEAKHECPRSECLPDLLREQVRVQPNNTAVVCENKNLTYRQLVESSSSLAVYLQHIGVIPDDCVGMFAEPSIDLMVGAWGILSSGSAYLPLSPEYPEERLRYILKDSRAKVIFSQEELRTRVTELAPRGTTIVTLKDVAKFARPNAQAERSDFETTPHPSNLAYIIYTSGSTGKPKGVMIEHRSIVNQMHWLKTVYKLNQEKTILQKTPVSFDAAQWELLASSCGSKVIMGSPGVYRDPGGLIKTIVEHNVTTLQCVPTLLQALLDTDEFHSCTSLTQIFSGGEVLSKSLALQCTETLPECELVNLYGPTECTINSSSFVVDKSAVGDSSNSISIGAPVHNTQYYILDDRRSPVAVGEIGELHISGVQLARGYLHQPHLTADRFVDNPFYADYGYDKLYKTGDLAYWNADRTVQFVGRSDNQVKLRGFRIELDEIKLAIETHDWVKSAAVIVKNHPCTGFQNLIAFIELNSKEAALMDQGNHGAHHRSKDARIQVKAQLSNMGCREIGEISGKLVVDLPGKQPTREQRQRVFARKTYRFFEGGDVKKSDILQLFKKRATSTYSCSLDELSFNHFGEIIRYFGQYSSRKRLLPKYGYASPGSLYATQMYFEVDKLGSLKSGYYYYHPVHHQFILIKEKVASLAGSQIKIHFIGKKRAVLPVYKNNIKEVLEIEAGHMVGLFEEILPKYGLSIRDIEYEPAMKGNFECSVEDYYLGAFEIVPYAAPLPDNLCDIYVQAHPEKIIDLPSGQYWYNDGNLERISDELILRKHVIAINQQVYERSSLGITVISKTPKDWMSYIDLGRYLQHLQMNDSNLGFMSSGYSSKTGNDLPSAKRIESILKACGKEAGPSYFFVGGRVSEEQLRSEGMKEDIVHMKGPAEIIKDDLIKLLPHYMMPNRVIVLDELPITTNGKIDFKLLKKLEITNMRIADRPLVAPQTRTEEAISDIWKKEMKQNIVSLRDDFFESGGNSLIAVALINKINRELGSSLPLQVLFESPTIEKLARKVDGGNTESFSRLVRLQAEGSKEPVYCWPGLGGYTMNLRLLASKIGINRPFYGVQAHGINRNETPYRTIEEMATADIKIIRGLQPIGPYTLWGYSFGARVAFEAAYQLEQSGQRVENLFLIAPGSPKLGVKGKFAYSGEPTYSNKEYVTILLSVFSGSITDPALNDCLRVAKDEESFASFINERFGNLDLELIERIIKIVYQTYRFRYTFDELTERKIGAPVTIFKAQGDDRSFIENDDGYLSKALTVINLKADHYSMLRDPDINELVKMIRYRLHKMFRNS
jgi:amino acid adenylation domain-containing protein